MIRISNRNVSPDEILSEFQSAGSLEKSMVRRLAESNDVFTYNNVGALKFEMSYRAQIVQASRALNNSRFSFKVFRKSICNEAYWRRTNEGGFLLKSGVSAAAAMNDIFSANSSQYGTECATAIVIVFYKGLLDVYGNARFDKVFPRIYLMDWQHVDNKMGIRQHRDIKLYLPGDCRYFKNPDVDPLVPEWQGENAIDLGDGTYYGHGLGILTGDQIIAELNDYRIAGADDSAYLMDSATRPNFRGLYTD